MNFLIEFKTTSNFTAILLAIAVKRGIVKVPCAHKVLIGDWAIELNLGEESDMKDA